MVNLKSKKISGEEVKEINFTGKILQTVGDPYGIQQAVRQFLASQHRGTHKAKTRSEVKGSRRKLYRQKGTGNARAGDAKSPIRRHGGVAFGPVVRSHSIKINKNVRKKALSSAISIKYNSKQLHILDSMVLDKPKTKKIAELLKTWGLKQALFVSHSQAENFELACRNLPTVKFLLDHKLNVYQILKYSDLIVTEEALNNIENRISN